MTKLTDLCDIQYGYAFDSGAFTNDNSYPQLVRIRDVKRGYSETFYNGDYPDEYVLSAGDLLIGMDGEFNIARWKIDGALLNQRVCKIVAKDNTDEEFLRFALSKALKVIEDRTSFVTVKHLSARELNKLEIQVPSYDEQIKISDILHRLERIIDARQNELKSLDILIKARFVEMFEGNFPSVKLGDVIKTTSGGTPLKTHKEYYDNGTIPWLTSGEINAGVITKVKNFITEEGLNNSSAKIVPKNTVVIAMYGATAGVTGILRLETTTNQAVCSLLPSDRFIPEFLYYAVSAKKDWMISQCQGGGQPNISQGIIKSMNLIDAPKEEQIKFSDFAKQIDKSKVAVQKALDEAQLLFDSLMQEYFG